MKKYKLARSGIAPHIQAQSNAPTLLTQSSLTNTINLVPNDAFALSSGGTKSKQSSTDKTIPQNSLNQTEIKKQGDNLMDSNKSNRTIFKLHKGRDAKHIQIHLDENSDGQITIEELLNLGNSIRAYLSIFKEPFIDNRDAKIYEWQNDNGVRFRAVIAEIGGGTNLPSHTNSNE